MSLINEALRKAQNQRNQAPGLGDSTPMSNQPGSYTPRPNRLGLMIGLGFCIIILLGLVAGLTIVVISKDTPQTTRQLSPANPENTATQTTPATKTVRSKETANISAALPPKPAEDTVPESESLATEILEKPPEAAEEPIAEPEPSKEIKDWLAQATISGVRITSSSSKVILNNKAYAQDDTVNMNLGLKVLTIEPKRILFTDSNGLEYVKPF